MLDYGVLDALLVRVEAEVCAEECHGFVCGQICATGVADELLWMEFLDVQGDDDDLIRTCYGEVTQLAVETQEQMYSTEFGLQLLLPDEDVSLSLRVEALSNWCYGFLNGYGVSEAQHTGGISEECNEVMEDFSQICRLGIDAEDPEDEQSLIELSEYVRMGTLLIFEELQPEYDRPELLH